MRKVLIIAAANMILSSSALASGQGGSLPGARALFEAEARECRQMAHDFVHPASAKDASPSGSGLDRGGIEKSWVTQAHGRTAEVLVGDSLVEISVSRGFVSWVLFRGVSSSVPNCQDPAGLEAKAMPLSQARSAALWFLSERGLDGDIESLVPTQSALGPASGSCAYTFRWNEMYDDSGVALRSEEIRVVVHPLSGEVVSFSRFDNTYRKPIGVLPDRCRAIVTERYGDRPGFRLKRMKLMSVFSPTEEEVPLWVVDYEYLGEAERNWRIEPQGGGDGGALIPHSQRVVVHAVTGLVTDDVEEFFEQPD